VIGQRVQDRDLCWRHDGLQRQAAVDRGEGKGKERAAACLGHHQLRCLSGHPSAGPKFQPEPGRLDTVNAAHGRGEQCVELGSPPGPGGGRQRAGVRRPGAASVELG